MIARLSFVVAFSFVSAGAAWAGSCVTKHKELNQIGASIQQLQKEREEAVIRFDAADEARYNAQSDLNMVKAGASAQDAGELVARVADHNGKAEAEKAKIDELNAKLATLAENYQTKAAEFNKSCVN